MGRPFVKDVESNLKGGCKVALGEKTLIVGRNGAGKSTITQAVELALTGSVSDVAGRAMLARDGDLVALLAPGGSESLVAGVNLSTVGSATWSCVAGKRAQHAIFSGIDKDRVLPLRAVREAILGSPETGRKWILGMAGSDTAGLVLKLEGARKRAREETAKAKALRATVAAQAAGLPTEGTVTVAKSDAVARQALADVEVRLQAAEQALAEAEAALRALPKLPAPPTTRIAEVGSAIVAVLTGQIEADGAKCGVCGSAFDARQALNRRQSVEAKIAEATAGLAAWHEQKARLDALRLDYGAAVAEVDRLIGERARLTAIRDAHDAEGSPEDAALAARWESIRALEAQAKAAEVDAASADADATTFAADLSRAVEAARTAFEEQVQKYLPPGDTFGIDLMDGDREVFRVGLRRGGKLHAALSGAEWARVVAAVAAACLPAGDAPAVVIPEERAFDAETLNGVLLAFDAIPAQVIVTSPVAPSNGVPAGWTVIEVGEPVDAGLPLGAVDLFEPSNAPAEQEITLAGMDSENAPIEKKARKPRKDKGVKRGPAGTSPVAPPAAGTSPANGGGPGWCAACQATIMIGTCDHGVKAPATPPRTAVDDLFD